MAFKVYFLLTLLVGILNLSVTPANAQTSNGIVTGSPGTCALRRNIQTLQSSYPEQFNMLVLALNELYDEPEANPDSYFGISGIHGAPFKPWYQPAPGSSGAPRYNTNLGYCFHGTPIFSTWHRPYLLSLEQLVVRRAIQIAERFTVGTEARTTYLNAAQALRLPYWDWSDSSTRSAIPNVVLTRQTIPIVKPVNGVPQAENVRNPFYNYGFKDMSWLSTQNFSGNFLRWNTTVREPTSSGVSQDSLASTNMMATFSTRRSNTFSALTSQSRFNSFSNALEGVHDNVHVTVGGSNPSGHMIVVTYSAFDPIFWLHHTNVDRLVAMWQAMWPGVYMTSRTPGTSTYANIVQLGLPADTLSTPLTPFKRSDGSWWTSTDIRDASSIWRYNYGYEEVPCSYSTQSTTALRDFTTSRAYALYGPSGTQPAARKVKTRAMGSGKERDNYIIRATFDASELLGSWTIHFFIAQPAAIPPANWYTEPGHIGAISAFGDPNQRMASRAVVREMTITETLVERGVDLSSNDMKKYLKKNLQWYIVGDNGAVIAPATIKTIKIGVYANTVTYPDAKGSKVTELPKYSDPEPLPDATVGKPGGVTDEDSFFDSPLVDGSTVNTA